MILALARPDPKKNLATLVEAFGECRPLRELANLVHLDHLLFCNIFYFGGMNCFDCTKLLNWL